MAMLDGSVVAADRLRRCISQRSMMSCANKVESGRGMHNLPNRYRAEGGAVPEENTANFVLVMATQE